VVEYPQWGRHLHHAGLRPPVGRVTVTRAGRHRPAGLRERVRPVPGAAVTRPHDVPTIEQLVEAVREWLEGDVMTSTEGRLQFHARVAPHMLAMVEREPQPGPAPAAAHPAPLAALGA